MNIAKGARTRVQKSPGGSFVDVNLHNIFAATRKGVSCNVILTLKLKCSVKEATKSDGTFYRWDERSPAVPGRDTIWTVAGTAVGTFAVKLIWPHTKVQLCYWHDRYWPAQAQQLIPHLEVCWGSLPTRRPLGDHFVGRCNCPSKAERVEEEGRLEPANKDERDSVLEIMRRHFHLHPLIPDENGTFKSAETIHRECAAEMYTWCKARGYYRLWAYLFTSWYSEGQWKLWARSAEPNSIPTVKTTMIVESHWRILKHNYLHRFNRPRVDLVVGILITRVIPDAIHKYRRY
ncbi:hypothetical protein VTN49DRAFT_6781 [Thermomyces lanuginosus]|uniref:uncharacterized protein n=1 Tax=Thermomyces lanuginosus TaxID=5541 RepID=UPI003742E7E6